MSKEYTRQVKGRIFGLRTNDGRSYNARLVRETDCYLTIADNNDRGRLVKLSKSNVRPINCG